MGDIAMRVGYAIAVILTASASAAERSQVADAAMRGDTSAVRALLQQKADVNTPQADGATAIQWAAYRNDLEMADVLLAAGANAKAIANAAMAPLR